MWHGSDTSKSCLGLLITQKQFILISGKIWAHSRFYSFFLCLNASVALFYKLGEMVYLSDIQWFVWKILLYLELVISKLYPEPFYPPIVFSHLYYLLFLCLLPHPQCYHANDKWEIYVAKFMIWLMKFVNWFAVSGFTFSHSDRERRKRCNRYVNLTLPKCAQSRKCPDINIQ